MHFVDWIVDQELIKKWRENNGPSPLTVILYGGDGGLKPASSAMTGKGKLVMTRDPDAATSGWPTIREYLTGNVCR